MLFVQALLKDADIEIRINALKVLSDALLIYGCACFKDQEADWVRFFCLLENKPWLT
jgi:hypothetical protein